MPPPLCASRSVRSRHGAPAGAPEYSCPESSARFPVPKQHPVPCRRSNPLQGGKGYTPDPLLSLLMSKLAPQDRQPPAANQPPTGVARPAPVPQTLEPAPQQPAPAWPSGRSGSQEVVSPFASAYAEAQAAAAAAEASHRDQTNSKGSSRWAGRGACRGGAAWALRCAVNAGARQLGALPGEDGQQRSSRCWSKRLGGDKRAAAPGKRRAKKQ